MTVGSKACHRTG